MSLGTAAEQASRSCGLPKATCMTLLEAGWTLVTDIKEPTRWVSPARATVTPIVIQPGAITIVNDRDPHEVAAGVVERIGASA